MESNGGGKRVKAGFVHPLFPSTTPFPHSMWVTLCPTFSVTRLFLCDGVTHTRIIALRNCVLIQHFAFIKRFCYSTGRKF